MKNCKRFLVCLLCAVMLMSVLPVAVFADSTDKHTGEIVELGSYPQGRVKNTELIEKLNSKTLDENNNVTYKDTKYRNYKDNWYKYEPLKWRVMTVVDDRAILISDKVIDSKPMNTQGSGSKWENSYLSNWLTNTFKPDAFGDLSNLYDISVSVPSTENLTNLDYGFSTNSDRIAEITEFANTEYAYYYWTKNTWTFGIAYAYVVLCDTGSFTQYFFQDQTNGVRPMIGVDASKIGLGENEYCMGKDSYCFQNYGDKDSVGHCFGMSMTSSAYYLGLFNRPNGVKNTYSLKYDEATGEPKSTSDIICYYQAIQGKFVYDSTVAGGTHSNFISDCLDVFGGGFYNIDYDWNSVVNYVKNHKHDNKGDLVIVYEYSKISGPHAVNFLRYEVVDGQERIYIYDNNFPDIEAYFCKDSDGKIHEKSDQKSKYVGDFISDNIPCLTLLDVRAYFNAVKLFPITRAIYAYQKDVKVDLGKYYEMILGNETAEEYNRYCMIELPDDISQVEIIPLHDNAEFRYMDKTYKFGKVDENTVGILKLAESDDDVSNVEFIITDKDHINTNSDDSDNPCTCKCHSSGFSLFIWKIGNFFHRIFHMDKYRECPCGNKMHW